MMRIYCRDDLQQYASGHEHLNSEEARRLACAVAKLPELMMPQEFIPRASGFRWSAKRPFHVALDDVYVRGHWHWMEAMCSANEIEMRPTGEKLERDGMLWLVYEFANKLDAIMFWLEFNGRWLFQHDFIYPEKSEKLPKMKRIKTSPMKADR